MWPRGGGDGRNFRQAGTRKRPETRSGSTSIAISAIVGSNDLQPSAAQALPRAMIFIPLPFVVTLFLAVVLIQLVKRNEGQLREVAAFVLLIAIYAVQSVMLGLRWGYGMTSIMPAQIVLAMVIAPLGWVSFKGLTGERPQPLWRAWSHLAPACVAILLLIFWRDPIELLIQAVFAGYGAALLWLARGGPDVLVASRLDGSVMSYRALVVTGLATLGSVVADLVISFDMMTTGGAYAPYVVVAANIVTLLFLAGAATAAGLAQTSREEDDGGVLSGTEAGAGISRNEDDALVAAQLDRMMAETKLYKDADLNLGRIARRMTVPARRVSSAVNRIHNKSVSQYVNDFRVREACRLLSSTDEPVTRVMFEAGFQTKSNFNREFLRVTGKSPSDFRRSGEGRVAEDAAIAVAAPLTGNR
jgi:AraC-like DNA-binding protein